VKFDDLLPIVMVGPCVRGFQVSVSRGDELWSGAYGATTASAPMDVATLHHVWCATKPILAMAAGIADVEGSADLCEPLSEYASRFPGLRGHQATLWDALCHDAGLISPRAFELWSAPTSRRRTIMNGVGADETQMAAYSEIAAWTLISLSLDRSSSQTADRVNAVLDSMGTGEHIVMDGVEFHASLRDRVGVHYGEVGSGRRPLPLLAELLPHVLGLASPVLGGLASAEGICRMYRAMLVVPFLRTARDRLLRYQRGDEYDQVLRRRCNFSAGFMIDLVTHGYGDRIGESSFGYTGWMGSSWGFADPARDLAVGFTHNGFLSPELNDPMRSDVVSWVYDNFA